MTSSLVDSSPARDLESRGSLVRKLDHRYSVIQLTRTEAQRICELRRVLEPKVLEWATARITSKGISELE